MRRFGICGVLLVVGLLWPRERAAAQVEIVEQIIADAIMEVDLGVQKVQTETIQLQEAEKLVENEMEQLDLDDITDWVQNEWDLFNGYYQELWQVKAALSTYGKVVSMIDRQAQLIRQEQAAMAAVQQDKHFSAAELNYIISVYTGIVKQSANNIAKLYLVIESFVTQMSDGDRLALIDGAAVGIDQNANDLDVFTQQNALLSLERAQDEKDINQIKLLYGIR
jgi:Neuraminidase (sialidase)